MTGFILQDPQLLILLGVAALALFATFLFDIRFKTPMRTSETLKLFSVHAISVIGMVFLFNLLYTGVTKKIMVQNEAVIFQSIGSPSANECADNELLSNPVLHIHCKDQSSTLTDALGTPAYNNYKQALENLNHTSVWNITSQDITAVDGAKWQFMITTAQLQNELSDSQKESLIRSYRTLSLESGEMIEDTFLQINFLTSEIYILSVSIQFILFGLISFNGIFIICVLYNKTVSKNKSSLEQLYLDSYSRWGLIAYLAGAFISIEYAQKTQFLISQFL